MAEFKPVHFGKYILLDKIATGGMAELHRAKITGVKGFEKLIAIKKILPHLTAEESLVASFIDEAKLAAFLQHPNIVQIYDFGKMEGAYFLAMEYLFGKDLKSVLKKSAMTNIPLTLEDSLYITARVCNGLHYAHNLRDFHGNSLNIIHRDIGPQNVFITYDGQVKIIDFGIAKAAIKRTSTQSDLIKGKVAYMSPEQAQGKKVDHRSDIYSIGILLYELVTNQRMFSGDMYQIYEKVCHAEFEPAENAGKDLPADVYRILSKALAKEPVDRYQSADDTACDLDNCISKLSFFPNDKSLAQYMKGLFEKEAEDEEHAMRQATLYDFLEGGESQEREQNQDVGTASISTQDFTLRSKRKILAGAIAAVLMLVAAYLSMVSVKAPFETKNTVNKNDMHTIIASNTKTGPEATGSLGNSVSGQKSVSTGPEELNMDEGKRLIQESRFKEAVLFFEGILLKDPLKQNMLSPLYAEALNGLASECSEEQPEKAKELLLKSIVLNPQGSSAYFELGRIYTREKKYAHAIADYEKAIELDKDLPGAYYNLGYIYYAVKKDYAAAEKMYQHAVQLSPPFLDEALFNLALAQARLGNTEECIKNLGRAISVNPNNNQAKDLLKRLIRKT